MEILLISLVLLILYTYVGYGLIMFILQKLLPKKNRRPVNNIKQKVTLVIAAYNEEEIIEAKIKNTLELDYPPELLQVLFVTDGSSDNTNNILMKYPQVRYSYLPERRGKIHAVNRIMETINTPITVFSDANVMLNKAAIKKLVYHFNQDHIGAVSGEKVVWSSKQDKASAAGEGFYWKYESFLKNLDAQVNSLVGSAGELFAIRTRLFEKVPENIIIEDFYLTMSIAMEGHKVAYEPEAIALETASASILEEEKRKVRISAGGIQAIVKLVGLLNIFKYGLLSFQYISHRVLRWTLAPAALPIIFGLNLLLVGSDKYWDLLFLAQVICYGLALFGYFLKDRPTRYKLFYIPFYFVFMNVSVMKGWLRYFKNSQTVVWEKSARIQMEHELEIDKSLIG